MIIFITATRTRHGADKYTFHGRSMHARICLSLVMMSSWDLFLNLFLTKAMAQVMTERRQNKQQQVDKSEREDDEDKTVLPTDMMTSTNAAAAVDVEDTSSRKEGADKTVVEVVATATASKSTTASSPPPSASPGPPRDSPASGQLQTALPTARTIHFPAKPPQLAAASSVINTSKPLVTKTTTTTLITSASSNSIVSYSGGSTGAGQPFPTSSATASSPGGMNSGFLSARMVRPASGSSGAILKAVTSAITKTPLITQLMIVIHSSFVRSCRHSQSFHRE